MLRLISFLAVLALAGCAADTAGRVVVGSEHAVVDVGVRTTGYGRGDADSGDDEHARHHRHRHDDEGDDD